MVYHIRSNTKPRRYKVEGMIRVKYTVMCENDVYIALKLSDLLSNEKVVKAIKSEFAKGLRNLTLSMQEDTEIAIKTEKEVYEFTVSKNDFADILELAEENAREHKRLKKECDGIALVDIETID